MSAASFWQAIDPRGLAARDTCLSGRLPLARFPRLRELSAVIPGDSEVDARLTFWKDEQGLVVISGRIQVVVEAVCQRCLEPLAMPVDSEFRLAFQDPGQPVTMQEDMELLEDASGTVVPAELVEEELLLALPLAPLHGDMEACRPLAETVTTAGEEQGVERPFEILKKLKQD